MKNPQAKIESINKSVVNISTADNFLRNANIKINPETGSFFTNATQVADERVLEKISQTITETYKQKEWIAKIYGETRFRTWSSS